MPPNRFQAVSRIMTGGRESRTCPCTAPVCSARQAGSSETQSRPGEVIRRLTVGRYHPAYRQPNTQSHGTGRAPGVRLGVCEINYCMYHNMNTILPIIAYFLLFLLVIIKQYYIIPFKEELHRQVAAP